MTSINETLTPQKTLPLVPPPEPHKEKKLAALFALILVMASLSDTGEKVSKANYAESNQYVAKIKCIQDAIKALNNELNGKDNKNSLNSQLNKLYDQLSKLDPKSQMDEIASIKNQIKTIQGEMSDKSIDINALLSKKKSIQGDLNLIWTFNLQNIANNQSTYTKIGADGISMWSNSNRVQK